MMYPRIGLRCGTVREVTATPLRAVLGASARRIREAADVRQEAVARAARTYGIAWSQPKVAALENGGKAVSVEELVLLPMILSSSCGRPVTLADLVPVDARITLSPETEVAGWVLLRLLAAEDLADVGPRDLAARLAFAAGLHPELQPETANKRFAADLGRASSAVHRLEALLDRDLTEAEHRAALSVPDDADQKAARKIGESPQTIVGLSRTIWGRSLADERDRIVTEQHPDASLDRRRALRGQVTRRLVAELAEFIRNAEAEGGFTHG